MNKNKYQEFTIYLDEKDNLIAPCYECGYYFGIDEIKPDRDTREFFCTSCIEKLEHKAQEEEGSRQVEYRQLVGF